MSYTGRKGSEGEAGVVGFLNEWFPEAENGIGASRGKSKGSNDIGDIEGVPYTSIEVKNHANPVLGSLVDNAEWKGKNSKRPVWFLVHKRAGFSTANAGHWSAVTTAEEFLKGFLPVTLDAESPLVLDNFQELALAGADIPVRITARYPHSADPNFQWTVMLHFRSWVPNHFQKREAVVTEFGGTRLDIMTVPVVIYPRQGEWDNPARWYVFSRLLGMARILETMGILPQDESEYAVQIQQ